MVPRTEELVVLWALIGLAYSLAIIILFYLYQFFRFRNLQPIHKRRPILVILLNIGIAMNITGTRATWLIGELYYPNYKTEPNNPAQLTGEWNYWLTQRIVFCAAIARAWCIYFDIKLSLAIAQGEFFPPSLFSLSPGTNPSSFTARDV